MTSSAGSRSSSAPSFSGEAWWRIEPQRLALELREHRGPLLGGQRLEEDDAVLAGQVVEELGDVGRVEVRDRRRRAPAGFSRISSSMSGPMTLASGHCGGF